jgi:nitroreductase
MFKGLVVKNRSYRRFRGKTFISGETLKELIELARLCPAGANKQPLKYLISNKPEKNNIIFQTLAWAGYLKDWDGPEEGERPSAYIIILCDTDIAEAPGCDHGIAAQTILLGAAEKGLGGCILGSIQRDELREFLKIPEKFKIMLVIALGEPAEKIVLEETGPSGDIKYYRDSEGTHHVPKRKLEDIILPY